MRGKANVFPKRNYLNKSWYIHAVDCFVSLREKSSKFKCLLENALSEKEKAWNWDVSILMMMKIQLRYGSHIYVNMKILCLQNAQIDSLAAVWGMGN